MHASRDGATLSESSYRGRGIPSDCLLVPDFLEQFCHDGDLMGIDTPYITILMNLWCYEWEYDDEDKSKWVKMDLLSICLVYEKQAFLEEMLCATLKKTTMSLSQMYPGNLSWQWKSSRAQ